SGVRRSFSDAERDRTGAGADVDDHPRPVLEMAGRADDEAGARLARRHDERARDQLEPGEPGRRCVQLEVLYTREQYLETQRLRSSNTTLHEAWSSKQSLVSQRTCSTSTPSSAQVASAAHIPRSISTASGRARTSGRNGHVGVAITAPES